MSVGMLCEACGRSPATKLVIRRHVGMLFMQSFYKLPAVLCRECGTKLLRGWTARTLVQGWWGLISFFVNWFVLVANAFYWVKVLRLEPPRGGISDAGGHVEFSD
jgi:hypothetical protein